MAKPFKIKGLKSDVPLPEAAERIMRARLKEYFSHIGSNERNPTPEQLHALRISGKRLRYSAESLRDLYPDRLEMIIDMLKRVQDMLGEMQDCIVFSQLIEGDLSRLRKRKPGSPEIVQLERLIESYRERHRVLTGQFLDLWHGMASKGIRRSLRKMISAPAVPPSVSVDQAGDESGSETVVDVDDGHV